VRELRARHHGRIVIDAVVPDYHARYSQALRRRLGPPPASRDAGRPGAARHAAEKHFRGSKSGRSADHALDEIWMSSPAFKAFAAPPICPRPCHSCERREVDFGGCRCQAFALTATRRRPIRYAISRPTMIGWSRSRQARGSILCVSQNVRVRRPVAARQGPMSIAYHRENIGD